MKKAYVWFGSFPSEAEFMKYANHSKAKCPFRSDFPFEYAGESFDQSFRHPKETLRQALVRLYYAPAYLDDVTARLRRQRAGQANAFKVVIARGDLPAASWPRQGLPLQLLGDFAIDDDAEMVHSEKPTIPMLDHEGWLSIWIGTASSTDFIESYMQEKSDADDERPPSQFGRDWKLHYDHDFLSHAGHPQAQGVRALLQGFSHIQPVLPAAQQAAASAGIEQGNFVVVAYGLDYSAKPPFGTLTPAGYLRLRGKPSKKTPLQFVGAFRYAGECMS